MPLSALNVGPAVTGVNHVLKGTYVNACLPANCDVFAIGDALTVVPLDAVTAIHCPAPIGTTCTITDDAWIELENTSSATNNPEGLYFYVDGTPSDAFWDGAGGTPRGQEFEGLAHKTAVAFQVSRGTHTVQTQTLSLAGASGGAWTATYRVYVP